MRPVDSRFPVSQEFGSYATGGVRANQFGTEVEQLVYQYGNYQPFGHAGQDIACPIGTPVHAIAAGTVLWADWGTTLPGDESDRGYRQRWYLYKTFPGIVTVIQHDGWISVYAHLSDAPLNPGDRVSEGQQIALSGNTRAPGVSLAAHLHVEALTDMSYSSGNGLIYGRTNPEPFYGTYMAAMGGTITPLEQGFLMALNDAEQAELLDTVRNLKGYLYSGGPSVKAGQGDPASVFGRLITTQAQGRDVQLALTAALPNLPAAVLNQSFKLADGTVTNLAGILTAIHAQPAAAAGPGSVADPTAVVRALRDQLNK